MHLKKLIHFSSQPFLAEYSELVDLKNQFEILTNVAHETPAKMLKNNYDIIELAAGDFELFKPLLQVLDLRTSRFGVADTLIKFQNDYRPMHLLSESVYKAILLKVPDLKTSESAVVIGDYDFVLAVTCKLAQSGFANIIIATAKNKLTNFFIISLSSLFLNFVI